MATGETKEQKAAAKKAEKEQAEAAEAKKTNEISSSLDDWFALQVANGYSGDDIKAVLAKWEPTGAVGYKEQATNPTTGHYANEVEAVTDTK